MHGYRDSVNYSHIKIQVYQARMSDRQIVRTDIIA